MEIERYIKTSAELRKKISSVFGVKKAYVSQALNYKRNNLSSRKMRKMALENGAIEVAVAPVYETIFSSEENMIQKFSNGYRIEMDKSTGFVRVYDIDSHLVEEHMNMLISEYCELQNRVSRGEIVSSSN